MSKPTTQAVSSNRKSGRTVVVYRKHRSLKDLFFMNVAILTLTTVMLGCVFFIFEFSATTKINHESSTAKDCYNFSTAQITTVPAGTAC